MDSSLHRYAITSGLVPVVQDIKYDGRSLETLEAYILKNCELGSGQIEVSVGGMSIALEPSIYVKQFS